MANLPWLCCFKIKKIKKQGGWRAFLNFFEALENSAFRPVFEDFFGEVRLRECSFPSVEKPSAMALYPIGSGFVTTLLPCLGRVFGGCWEVFPSW